MKFKYSELNLKKNGVHSIILNEIQSGKKILDLGCATGYIAKELKKKQCIVWGVEMDSSAAKIAQKYLEKVFISDIRDIDSLNIRKDFFDYVLFLDVIEHIREAEPLLSSIKKYLKRDGRLIISTPNIAHISSRMSLLFGKFEYKNLGIMDKTHVHFYTKKTLLHTLDQLNYKIDKIGYSADFGQIPLGRILNLIPEVLQRKITNVLPTLLAVQFIVTCH